MSQGSGEITVDELVDRVAYLRVNPAPGARLGGASLTLAAPHFAC